MAAPNPVREPVTSAFLPSRRKRSRIILFLKTLFVAGFQTRSAGAKPGLYVYHAELPVEFLAMRRHRPEEANPMAGHRHVGMVARRHEHRVAVAYHCQHLGILRVLVDQLDG